MCKQKGSVGIKGSKGTPGPHGSHTPAFDIIMRQENKNKITDLASETLIEFLAAHFVDVNSGTEFRKDSIPLSYHYECKKFSTADLFKEVKRRLGDNVGGTTGPTGRSGPS